MDVQRFPRGEGGACRGVTSLKRHDEPARPANFNRPSPKGPVLFFRLPGRGQEEKGEPDVRSTDRPVPPPARNACRPRGAGSRRSDDALPGRPDLRDDVVRLRLSGARRRSLRPPAAREHLHADHEPDDGRLRAADRRSGGGRRGRRDLERPGRRNARDPEPRESGRLPRLLFDALRRDARPLLPHPSPPRHHDAVRRHQRHRGRGRRHRRHDARRLRRDDREPEPRRPRSSGAREDRPCGRCSARRRQHLRHPAPLPAPRARSRHRRSFGHEVDRRTRDGDRRRGRRRREVRFREGPPLPVVLRRARARLSRPLLLEAVRRRRLGDPPPRRPSPRPRRLRLPLQLVPLPAGTRDAPPPDPPPLGECPRPRAPPRESPGRCLGPLPGPRLAREPRPREEIPRRWLRRRPDLRRQGGRDRGEKDDLREPGSSPSSRTSATPRA